MHKSDDDDDNAAAEEVAAAVAEEGRVEVRGIFPKSKLFVFRKTQGLLLQLLMFRKRRFLRQLMLEQLKLYAS